MIINFIKDWKYSLTDSIHWLTVFIDWKYSLTDSIHWLKKFIDWKYSLTESIYWLKVFIDWLYSLTENIETCLRMGRLCLHSLCFLLISFFYYPILNNFFLSFSRDSHFSPPFFLSSSLSRSRCHSKDHKYISFACINAPCIVIYL